MLFEEFIEQHGVDRVEAQGLRFPVQIAHDQIRVHCCDILSDETIMFDVVWIHIAFCPEGDRFERKQPFARFIHGLMSSLYRREDTATPSLPSLLGPKASIATCRPPTIAVRPMLRIRVVLVSSPAKPVTKSPI